MVLALTLGGYAYLRSRSAATATIHYTTTEAKTGDVTQVLEGRANHRPSELSGGQQQRAAIARAIVTKPGLILADEPTGNLDTARSREIMEVLAQINRDEALTVLMVTHESDMAAYAHRIVTFVDGRIASDHRNAAIHAA